MGLYMFLAYLLFLIYNSKFSKNGGLWDTLFWKIAEIMMNFRTFSKKCYVFALLQLQVDILRRILIKFTFNTLVRPSFIENCFENLHSYIFKNSLRIEFWLAHFSRSCNGATLEPPQSNLGAIAEPWRSHNRAAAVVE